MDIMGTIVIFLCMFFVGIMCWWPRASNCDVADGSQEELERLVTLIRKRWPDVRIIVRGDSGFCRDNIMSWCESSLWILFIRH